MEDKRIKILYIVNLNKDSGVACFLMNYLRHMDLSKYDMSFITLAKRADNFHSEVEGLGYKIYEALDYKSHPIEWARKVKFIIASEKADILHVNEAVMCLPALYYAKKINTPVRIAHSHNAGMPSKFKTAIVVLCRPAFYFLSNFYFSCSNKAGEYLFGKKLYYKKKNVLVNNAIEVRRFKVNNSLRTSLRLQMGIADKVVLGHIGRFNFQKNHNFLIDIMVEICKIRKDVVLILAGDGDTRCSIEQKVRSCCLENNIIFLGIRSDVYRYLSVMDIFLLPSFYEGLPVVGIEAQASGLPCILSDKITKEVAITDSCSFLPISSARMWAEAIQNTKINSLVKREDINKKMMKSYYDINIAAKKLENEYNTLVSDDLAI